MPISRCIIFILTLLVFSQSAWSSQGILRKALREWTGSRSRVSLTERALIQRYNAVWKKQLSAELGQVFQSAKTMDDLFLLHAKAQKRLTRIIEKEAFPGIKPKTFELAFEVPAAHRSSFEALLRDFDEVATQVPHSASRFHEVAKAEADIRSLTDTAFISSGCVHLTDPIAIHQLARVTHRVKGRVQSGMELSSNQMSETLVNAFQKVFREKPATLWKKRICPLVRVCKIIDPKWAKPCFAH